MPHDRVQRRKEEGEVGKTNVVVREIQTLVQPPSRDKRYQLHQDSKLSPLVDE